MALTTPLRGKLLAGFTTSELQSDGENLVTDQLRTDMVYVPRLGYMTEAQFLKRNTCG